MPSNHADLAVTRVRHPLKFRLLQVKHIEPLTPHLARITFTGDELHDFTSASFDDHLKVFFPAPGADKPVLPVAGPDGPVFPEGERPVARDYTPRRFDRNAGELVIDFVLHDVGPASDWAAQAQVGHYVGIGGPRGSFWIPDRVGAHPLFRDENPLPARGGPAQQPPPRARAG